MKCKEVETDLGALRRRLALPPVRPKTPTPALFRRKRVLSIVTAFPPDSGTRRTAPLRFGTGASVEFRTTWGKS